MQPSIVVEMINPSAIEAFLRKLAALCEVTDSEEFPELNFKFDFGPLGLCYTITLSVPIKTRDRVTHGWQFDFPDSTRIMLDPIGFAHEVFERMAAVREYHELQVTMFEKLKKELHTFEDPGYQEDLEPIPEAATPRVRHQHRNKHDA